MHWFIFLNFTLRFYRRLYFEQSSCTSIYLLCICFAGSFVCEYCHLPFISKAKFLRHRRIHTEENPYMCIYCHETFSHHSDLRKHRNELHMTNKSFKCNFCPKTFGTRAELKGHLWRHTGIKYKGWMKINKIKTVYTLFSSVTTVLILEGVSLDKISGRF